MSGVSALKEALVVIDVQEGFRNPKWGTRNQIDLEKNVRKAIEHARGQGITVIHVHHHSRNPDSPLFPQRGNVGAMACAQPLSNEHVLVKHEHSAFVGTPLREILTREGIAAVTLCGVTTDHCVSTTARFAHDFGYHVTLLHDCCATHNRTSVFGREISADEIHESHLASLQGEFAQVLSLHDWQSIRTSN